MDNNKNIYVPKKFNDDYLYEIKSINIVDFLLGKGYKPTSIINNKQDYYFALDGEKQDMPQ